MSKKKKDREQLAFDLNEILQAFEGSFAKKLARLFRRITLRIIKKSESLKAFNIALNQVGIKETTELKELLQGYYKQIGKLSIKHLNKEIKELTGKTTKIKVPDIQEGLRYRAEQIALKHTRDLKKELRQMVKDTPGAAKDKAVLLRAIRKGSKTFINRHIVITSRMESVKAANQQRIEAVKKSTIVKGFQFLAVLDDRTTDICDHRAFHVLKPDDPNLKSYTPPLHFGCRSLLSPVTIYEKDVEFTPKKEVAKVIEAFPPNFGKSKLPKKAA